MSFAAFGADIATKGAKLYGDAARGREVVDRWWSECHSRGETVDDRVPSLQALTKRMTRSEGAIRAFLMQPHSPMPPLEISTQQIEDIIAYLHTLPSESPR